MRKHLFLSFVAASFLAACAATVDPPKIPPSDVTNYPELATEGYAETTVIGDYPLALSDLRTWLMDGNKIVAEMEPTDNIAKPVDIVYFTGEWPNPGATRRVEMSDGHFVLERVLSNAPEKFEYQIWGLTNAAGKNVDHIHGIQAFSPLDEGGTRLTWSYRVKPNAGFKKPFVQRFVNQDVTPFLTQAVENTVALAERTVASGNTE